MQKRATTILSTRAPSCKTSLCASVSLRLFVVVFTCLLTARGVRAVGIAPVRLVTELNFRLNLDLYTIFYSVSFMFPPLVMLN